MDTLKNILDGFCTAVDIYPNTDYQIPKKGDSLSDWYALRSDFKAVGEDLKQKLNDECEKNQ